MVIRGFDSFIASFCWLYTQKLMAMQGYTGFPLLSWVKCMGNAIILHITEKWQLKSTLCSHDAL